MGVKKTFLTLSIRHQITIYIIVTSITCLLSLLTLFSIYSQIILNMQSRKRNEYYFEKYKEIIDAEVKFQSFILYLYEQIIKVFNSQLYYYNSNNDIVDILSDQFQNEYVQYYDYPEKPKVGDNNTFYLLNFSNDVPNNYQVRMYLNSIYPSLNNKLNVITNFSLSFFGRNKSLINDYNFILLEKKNAYSINWTQIQKIRQYPFSEHYNGLIDIYVNKYSNYMNDFKIGELDFMDIFFENKYALFTNYINDNYIKNNFNGNRREYLNSISSNFQFIDYSNGDTFITDSGNKDKAQSIEQNTIITEYINFIFSIIQNISDINVIPIFPENNTIMSENLCYFFLYKQLIIQNITSEKNLFEEAKIKKIINNIQKGKSDISACILNEKYDYDISQNIQKILNIKFDKFYSKKNTREFSLFKLSNSLIGKEYYCAKYTFPDFTSILNFKPTFFTLDQLNLYCFKTFYQPRYYYENMLAIFYNRQYFTILLLFYLWLLVCLYMFLQLNKLLDEIIDPINKLSEALSRMEIKKDNIITYEPDDSINELFKLCHDLFLGNYRQKRVHDTDIEKSNYDQNEGNKNINNFSGNLKINRKLIEEMVENKNDINFKEGEIKSFNINNVHISNLGNNNKQQIKEKRKSIFLKKPNFHNNIRMNIIQNNIKKTNSITKALNVFSKKKSLDVNLFKTDYLKSAERSKEDILETEILLNYKVLYDITDFTFNYDIKYNNKFISKNSNLLYNKTLNRGNRHRWSLSKIKVKGSPEDVKAKNDTSFDEKLSLKEFDKSVMQEFETQDIFFLWYKEAKLYRGEQFLQTNHIKELNNLCNLIGNENKKTNTNFNNKEEENNQKNE